MTTVIDYAAVKRLDETASRLGFCVGYASHRSDQLALKLVGENYPLYSRDVDMMTGSVDSLTDWLRGFEKALNYTQMLRFNQAAAEKKYSISQEKLRVRLEKRKMMAILKSPDGRASG